MSGFAARISYLEETLASTLDDLANSDARTDLLMRFRDSGQSEAELGNGIFWCLPTAPSKMYNTGMKKPQSEDASQAAARVVRESTARHEQPLPADLEAAWKQWSAAIQKVDARGMVLLRAAFEAGAEAARQA